MNDTKHTGPAGAGGGSRNRNRSECADGGSQSRNRIECAGGGSQSRNRSECAGGKGDSAERIRQAFQNGKAFIPFVTGGDPDIETTERLIPALCAAGADLVEIGIPFSDPIAEGPVIQAADERALAAGCSVDKLFSMVARLRETVSAPLVFMTYYNPIFTYGKEKFLNNCKAAGVDGLIVPDLPFEEKNELSGICRSNGVCLVSMIAPTSDARIETIAREAEGFLYCVSSLGVTGVRGEIGQDALRMVRRAKTATDIPCAVGFGVSTPEQARSLAREADGVIVGSAIVSLIAEHGRDSVEPVRKYAVAMKQAVRM